MPEEVALSINGEIVNIDKECVDLVNLFNNNGLKTEFCCSGHNEAEFFILFDSSVTDDKMLNFIEKISVNTTTCILGHFYKWYRKIGLNNTNSWYVNWEYKAFSIEKAEYDYGYMVHRLNDEINIS